MINEYLIYVTLAITITAIPGPAVILTVKNSMKYGFRVSIAGILGNFASPTPIKTVSCTRLNLKGKESRDE